MNSAILTISCLLFFLTGYKFYSKYLSEKIFELSNDEKTPAHDYRDNIDYVPTNKHILFGHHFTSIAGAAPIIGPCIAVYWGWLPAILWVVLGTVFMGATHDFSALVISLKEKGKSIADISSTTLNNRIRIMFLIFVMCLTWLVLAVFANAIAGLFTKYSTAVLPVNIEIIIAIIIGYFIHKKNKNAFIPSVVALITLYIFVWIGSNNPINLEVFGVNPENVKYSWIIILFIYSSFASLIPVWILLQPRDYINSHQLIVGLSLIFLSILIIQPEINAPAITNIDKGPPIIPFLFVTIACGAISGFHGLVSSGTTSKQVNKMKDARIIGYGATLGEGSLALAATIAAVAGLSFVNQQMCLPWECDFNSAKSNALNVFIEGSSGLLQQIGLPGGISTTLIVVLVVSFAATTLDSATRIQRYIIVEFGDASKLFFLKNKIIATLLSIVPAYFIATNDSLRNELWQTFGASNQMLAALTLMIISIYFFKKGKNIIPLIIPMIVIKAITISALIIKFNSSTTILLKSINAFLITLIFWMIIEGLLFCYRKLKISS
ncbi:MAG: carbon starvation protein A [Candidatus Marinimicrobia bacterium]|nr:carbon starvation protein A [Candidatus Neomarinimicrobiota bacterium]